MTKDSPSFRSPIKRLQDTPLAQFTDVYRQRLNALGYSKSTQSHYIGGIAHFAVWMKIENISLNAICTDVFAQFIQAHLPVCRCPGKVQMSLHVLAYNLRRMMTIIGVPALIELVS